MKLERQLTWENMWLGLVVHWTVVDAASSYTRDRSEFERRV